MEATLTISTGTDTEGMKLDSELIAAMWPNQTSGQVADNFRDLIRTFLIFTYQIDQDESYQAAAAFIAAHATDTH